jgi:hypothetical protein
MEIEFLGNNSNEFASDFHSWIRNERLSGIVIDRKRAPYVPNTMGAEYLPIITAIVGAAPAIVEIVKSIQTWVQTRRPKTKLVLRFPDGSTVEVNTENANEISSLMNLGTNQLQALKSQ